MNTEQTQKLQVAAANGSISVTMRNPLDKEKIDLRPTYIKGGDVGRSGNPTIHTNEPNVPNPDWYLQIIKPGVRETISVKQ